MLQQIFDLLTTATGNLAYHLVLAFSILSAFQMAIPFLSAKPASDTRNRRMFFGLVCLLALQLGQFIFSGLAWQGVLDGAFWLPPVDRGVMLLSLVLVIWLWLLPEKDAGCRCRYRHPGDLNPGGVGVLSFLVANPISQSCVQ